MKKEENKEEPIMTNVNQEDDDKPICFGTYIGEDDLLCGKCTRNCKPNCIKITKIKIYP